MAVCCSALQCVAESCRELQCVAVCCSVLQCVAESCSVLQRVAVCDMPHSFERDAIRVTWPTVCVTWPTVCVTWPTVCVTSLIHMGERDCFCNVFSSMCRLTMWVTDSYDVGV